MNTSSAVKWGTALLGDVCLIDKTKHNGDTALYVGLEDISNNTGEFLGSFEPTVMKSTTFRFDERHLLYGRLRPYLNKVLTPNFEGHCSSEIFPLRPNGNLDRRYLFYWLTSDPVCKSVDSTSTGARMPRANMNEVMRFEVPLPSLEEQRRMVTVLDEAFEELDRAHALAEANLQDSKELFVASVDELLNTNRDDWHSGHFSEIVGAVFTGPFGSLLHKSDYIENETPIVNPENIVEGRIVPNLTKSVAKHILDRLRAYRLEAGDIVIARRGEMGRCAVVGPEQAGWLCGTGSFFVRTRADTAPKLVAHMLRTPFIVNKLSAIATGTTMSNLSNKALAKLPIELPSRDLQLRLLETIESLDQEIRSIVASYNARCLDLSCLRQSLLQRAFAGELT